LNELFLLHSCYI
jgi:hypothetical protein